MLTSRVAGGAYVFEKMRKLEFGIPLSPRSPPPPLSSFDARQVGEFAVTAPKNKPISELVMITDGFCPGIKVT